MCLTNLLKNEKVAGKAIKVTALPKVWSNLKLYRPQITTVVTRVRRKDEAVAQ